MEVVVFTKFVPNPQGTPELGPDHLLVRTAEGALDPGDEYGLELALQLAESEGAHVVAVSMGPDEAIAAVQRALAMGAHEGVLITDPALRGADALGTARVLAAAIARRSWISRSPAWSPPTATRARCRPRSQSCSTAPGSAPFGSSNGRPPGSRVERQVETGYDVLECALPAIITVTAGANEPRYPSLKGIMQAKQKPVERVSLSDLGLSDGDVAATQAVVDVTDAPATSGGEVIASGDDAVARIADLLAEAKVI